MRNFCSKVLPLSAVAASAAVLAAGCGGEATSEAARAKCPAAWAGGWQKLADRIRASVYCPRWLPGPLTGEIGGPWTSINSVDRDRSFLMSFIYKEGIEEIHVNFRGYPGKTAIPTCIDTQIGAGKVRRRKIPCFSDRGGERRIGDIAATVYTVNQDADQWHVLYAWRHGGSLYALSEHVAPPFSYSRVVRNLDRMLRSLVRVEPRSAA